MSTIKVDTLQTRAGSTAAVTGAGFVATDQIRGNTAANSVTVVAEGGTVTTNLQQGLAKAWARIDGTGTAALDDSFNCASLTDNGTGDYSVAITNDMSSVDTYYVIEGQYINSATTNGVDWANSTAAVVRYKVFDSSATDRDPVGFACIGDLA